ncbi:MAG: polyphosphate kinase 1 [Candidatus Eremiobacteraeota bacterium]|nr:polyphosphate kinase 1 [Candidatus Eremiobacteraeota bacterium]
MISSAPAALLNRELSWLDFNARVLALAQDEKLPLLERAKFLAIFSRNFDEFFQVRVAALKEQLTVGPGGVSSDGKSTRSQLRAVRGRVDELVAIQSSLFRDELLPALAQKGICIVEHGSLDAADRADLDRVFQERIFPVLTPLAVDPAHPFPYISNLSLNLVVVIKDSLSRQSRIARVKVPPLLPRFIEFADEERFIPVEQLIAGRLQALFPGMHILGHYAFRVTRHTDFALAEDDVEDLLEAVETVLQLRRRSPRAVRLEVHSSMPEDVRSLLLRELEVERSDVYAVDGLLDLGGLWSLYDLEHPELKFRPWTPLTGPRLAARETEKAPDIFQVLDGGDVLVHHPYDSFGTSVEAFLSQAARDPQVMAIKQTLYRTSVAESPIIRSLIRAAESGKQVVAVIEVTARFDEEANIGWARVLEEAGVHVVYGIVGLKTHAKIALVVRQAKDGIRRYSHVSTGNYNPSTANVYEDVGLMSADRELGADLTDLFNVLTGYSRHSSYRKLLVAPVNMRTALLDLIRRESAAHGRIILKVNNLVDPEIIEALYAASRAGADIDLIVRGICCLVPGLAGTSDRIRVRSILGRFLEHSRILYFGGNGRPPRYFIGSADLMPRNLDRRVEAALPVSDPALQQRLKEILDVDLDERAAAWVLNNDGSWTSNADQAALSSQERLQELALTRAAVRSVPGD